MKSLFIKAISIYFFFFTGCFLGGNKYEKEVIRHAKKGHVDKIKKILEDHKVNINYQDDVLKYTPLTYAIGGNHFNCVKFLIEKGATVKFKKDKNCDYHILWAASSGSLRMIKYLISKGSDIRTKDHSGSNILFYAIDNHPNRAKEIINYLLNKGFTIKARGQNGDSLLSAVTAKTHSGIDIMKFLIEKGVDINAQNDYGTTALMIACDGRFEERVELLLKNGADATIKDKKGKTAMDYALKYTGEDNSIKRILDKYAKD